MAATIQIRRGSTGDWFTANPVLGSGELGLDTTLNKIKVGDGSTDWNSLDFYESDLQPLDSTLTAIAAFDTNGFLVQTSTDNFAGRTIIANSTKIQVNNGNGVAANPSIDVNESNLTLNNIGGTLSIAKGGTGQTTSLASFNALSPLTTKGDLLSRDATNNIRVPVGVNNRYLVADSAQASGLDWKAIDVDSQNVSDGAPTSVLNLTNTHPNSSGLTYYDFSFSVDYELTTTGRTNKNYLVSFSTVYGLSSAADRYTYFRFLVNGTPQTVYDIVSFTTDTYRPTMAGKTFTLNNIAPGTIIKVVYGIATNLGTGSPGSTTIRNYGSTFSIYGVG